MDDTRFPLQQEISQNFASVLFHGVRQAHETRKKREIRDRGIRNIFQLKFTPEEENWFGTIARKSGLTETSGDIKVLAYSANRKSTEFLLLCQKTDGENFTIKLTKGRQNGTEHYFVSIEKPETILQHLIEPTAKSENELTNRRKTIADALKSFKEGQILPLIKLIDQSTESTILRERLWLAVFELSGSKLLEKNFREKQKIFYLRQSIGQNGVRNLANFLSKTNPLLAIHFYTTIGEPRLAKELLIKQLEKRGVKIKPPKTKTSTGKRTPFR